MPHHKSHHAHSHASALEPSHRRKAIAIAVLGALVVLSGVWADHTNRGILLTRDEASNSWSYFHQKSIKERIYESELSFSADLSAERIADLEETVARYKTEKSEIRDDAEAKETEVKNMLLQIQLIETISILFELAIILISVSLIVPFLWLEIFSLLAALSGASLAGWILI